MSNPGLCRRFIRSLREEQIYSVVRQIVPVESHFIIRYAQTLDKGKEHGRLEGRVGGEVRLLKWEFIFLVLFSGPLTAFSRKQFVRSELGQFSAHYNITVRELISLATHDLPAGLAFLDACDDLVLLDLVFFDALPDLVFLDSNESSGTSP